MLRTGFGINCLGVGAVLALIIQGGVEPLTLFLFCFLFLGLSAMAVCSAVLLGREPNWRLTRAKKQWMKRCTMPSNIETVPEDASSAWAREVMRPAELGELERELLHALAIGLTKA